MQNKTGSDSFSPGYCEYMVPAKADKKIILIRTVALIIGALLIGVFAGLLSKIPQVLFLWFVVVIGLEIIVFSKTRREFEYTIATGQMTFDVIYGKRNRKKLEEVRISCVDKVTYVGDGATSVIGENVKTVYACNKNDKEKYCMLVPSADGKPAKAVYFSGCKKVLDCIKYYNRACIEERKD